MKPLNELRSLLAGPSSRATYLRRGGGRHFCTECSLNGVRRKAQYSPVWLRKKGPGASHYYRKFFCGRHAEEFLNGRNPIRGTRRYPH